MSTGTGTTIDTSQFMAMCANLAKLTESGSIEDAVKFEVGKVLENCIRMTPAAKNKTKKGKSSISSGAAKLIWLSNGTPITSSNVDEFPAFLIEPSNWDGRGTAPKTITGGTMHAISGGQLQRHWSDARWARAQELKTSFLSGKKVKVPANIKKARGLSKKSWWEIANAVGLTLSVPTYVRNAQPSNGKTYVNGTAQREQTQSAMVWELKNSMPLLIEKLGGERILRAAIASRVKSFQMNMQKGVFNDISARASRYPGVTFT